jgi:hypothetical protein
MLAAAGILFVDLLGHLGAGNAQIFLSGMISLSLCAAP